MTRRKNNFVLNSEPKYCWVGEARKVCYDTREEAEVAAKVVEYDRGVSGLSVYKCEFGDHWHLTQKKTKSKK